MEVKQGENLSKKKKIMLLIKKRHSFLKSVKHNLKCVLEHNLKYRFFEFKSKDKRFTCCSIKYKYQLDTIKTAEREVKETKQKNNKLFSLIFFLINIVVIAVVLLINSGNENSSIVEIFQNIKWPFLTMALCVFILSIILDSLKFVLLIYQSTKRFRPYLSFKLIALGRYYDSITPLSSGGEPYQIYYLNNRGLKAEVSTSIPLMRHICWLIAFVITSSIFLICNVGNFGASNALIVTCGWIGLAINVVMLLTIVLLSTSKKIGPMIVVGVLKLLYKLKVIKDYQAAFRKTMRFVMNYQRCMRAFTTNIFYFILQLILAVSEILLSSMIAYFIYLAFESNPTATPSEIISIVILCNLAVSFIPMPGGSGVVEYSFITVYGKLFANAGIAGWATLLYRIFTYYFVLLIGIVVLFYDFLIGNKKAERYRKAHLFKDGFIFKDKFKRITFKLKRKNKNKNNDVKTETKKVKVEQQESEKQTEDKEQKIEVNDKENLNKNIRSKKLNTDEITNENEHQQIDKKTIKSVKTKKSVEKNK